MPEWRENGNGNFIFVEDGRVSTVFSDGEGIRRAIHDEAITRQGFETADDAMSAVDGFVMATSSLRLGRSTPAGCLPERAGHTDRPVGVSSPQNRRGVAHGT